MQRYSSDGISKPGMSKSEGGHWVEYNSAMCEILALRDQLKTEKARIETSERFRRAHLDAIESLQGELKTEKGMTQALTVQVESIKASRRSVSDQLEVAEAKVRFFEVTEKSSILQLQNQLKAEEERTESLTRRLEALRDRADVAEADLSFFEQQKGTSEDRLLERVKRQQETIEVLQQIQRDLRQNRSNREDRLQDQLNDERTRLKTSERFRRAHLDAIESEGEKNRVLRLRVEELTNICNLGTEQIENLQELVKGLEEENKGLLTEAAYREDITLVERVRDLERQVLALRQNRNNREDQEEGLQDQLDVMGNGIKDLEGRVLNLQKLYCSTEK